MKKKVIAAIGLLGVMAASDAMEPVLEVTEEGKRTVCVAIQEAIERQKALLSIIDENNLKDARKSYRLLPLRKVSAWMRVFTPIIEVLASKGSPALMPPCDYASFASLDALQTLRWLRLGLAEPALTTLQALTLSGLISVRNTIAMSRELSRVTECLTTSIEKSEISTLTDYRLARKPLESLIPQSTNLVQNTPAVVLTRPTAAPSKYEVMNGLSGLLRDVTLKIVALIPFDQPASVRAVMGVSQTQYVWRFRNEFLRARYNVDENALANYALQNFDVLLRFGVQLSRDFIHNLYQQARAEAKLCTASRHHPVATCCCCHTSPTSIRHPASVILRTAIFNLEPDLPIVAVRPAGGYGIVEFFRPTYRNRATGRSSHGFYLLDRIIEHLTTPEIDALLKQFEFHIDIGTASHTEFMHHLWTKARVNARGFMLSLAPRLLFELIMPPFEIGIAGQYFRTFAGNETTYATENSKDATEKAALALKELKPRTSIRATDGKVTTVEDVIDEISFVKNMLILAMLNRPEDEK